MLTAAQAAQMYNGAGRASVGPQGSAVGGVAGGGSGVVDVDTPLDENLLNEINDYLQGIVEESSPMIEMSDSPIRSQGASCVSTAISLCRNLIEVRLANCEIRDAGAIKLFEELKGSTSVEVVDLSGNPLTEKCFDAIETCLL